MKLPRKSSTYRAARRNKFFGRKPVGNTSPAERRKIWFDETATRELQKLQRLKDQQDLEELRRAPL